MARTRWRISRQAQYSGKQDAVVRGQQAATGLEPLRQPRIVPGGAADPEHVGLVERNLRQATVAPQALRSAPC